MKLWSYETLAVIIDTEGCIGIAKSQQKDRSAPSYFAFMRVGMTTPPFIHNLQENFGGRIYVSKKRNGNRLPLYSWSVSRKVELRGLLRCIEPHLILKRTQAIVALMMLSLDSKKHVVVRAEMHRLMAMLNSGVPALVKIGKDQLWGGDYVNDKLFESSKRTPVSC